MPTPKRGPRLGGGPAHQKLMLANLAGDLIRHGRIRTTVAKARTLRPYVEKLITKAKRGDLHARRQAIATLRDRDVVAYLFDEVGPRFADRDGGYTRILKLGPRKGDNTPMALIELVDRGEGSGDELIEESKAGRSRGLFGRGRRRAAESAGVAGGIDVADDEQVAAAIREATGQDVTPEPMADDVSDEADADAASAEDADAAAAERTDDDAAPADDGDASDEASDDESKDA